MAEERTQRRLAAILAADVVAYSRLMEQDEAATLVALKARRRDVLDPLVAKYQGRIFKTTGDGVLVEFASAVNAVHCAVDLQRNMGAANSGQSDDRHIVLRIGVNLGDVMVEGSDLYGDGVNIAARLQVLAEPGGILISGTAHDYVRNKVKVGFDELGAKNLKNIDQTVRTYRVTGISTVAVLAPRIVSDKPSIAVLPFTNMSGDPEQEYFSDGITEDIITDLSQVSALFVVARHTAFALKDKTIHVQQVASDLRVQYILEGSVRKTANRVRISAQLIDGTTGGHVWAGRYDRDFSDIFALQDEISKNVVDTLRVKILPEELGTITNRSTADPEAYRYYLVGHSIFLRDFSTSSFRAARRMFAKAAEIDSSYGRAYAGMAACDSFLWVFGDASVSSEQILSNSARALELEPDLAEAHAAAGMAIYASGRFEEATVELDRALKLDPSLWEACLFYGDCCRGLDLNKAIALFERAAELNSDDFISLCVLVSLYKQRGNIEQSLAVNRRSFARIEAVLSDHPDNADAIAFGSGALAFLGRKVEAEQWADRAIVADPDNYMVRYNVACTYALLNKADASIENLELIFSRVPRWHGWLLSLMRRDTEATARQHKISGVHATSRV